MSTNKIPIFIAIHVHNYKMIGQLKRMFWMNNISWRLGLTHWSRVMHICISKLTILGSDNGLAPSHYLNQGWNIVNWILRSKPQWNLNRNSYISIQENVFENVIWKVAAILWHQCVNVNFRVVSYITTSHFVVWLVLVITCDIFWYADPNLPETHRSYDKGNTRLRQHASLKCAAWRTHRCLGSHTLHKTRAASWLWKEYSAIALIKAQSAPNHESPEVMGLVSYTLSNEDLQYKFFYINTFDPERCGCIFNEWFWNKFSALHLEYFPQWMP